MVLRAIALVEICISIIHLIRVARKVFTMLLKPPSMQNCNMHSGSFIGCVDCRDDSRRRYR